MISGKLKEIEGINEELLSAILETTTDAVIVITYDHKICLFNEATVKLFGYEPDELLDNDLDILLPEEMRGDTHREKVKWFADKKHHPVAPTQRIGLNLQGRRKNKSIFYASIAISRVEYKGIPFMVAVVRDTTREKLYEQELELKTREIERYRKEIKGKMLNTLKEADAEFKNSVYKNS